MWFAHGRQIGKDSTIGFTSVTRTTEFHFNRWCKDQTKAIQLAHWGHQKRYCKMSAEWFEDVNVPARVDILSLRRNTGKRRSKIRSANGIAFPHCNLLRNNGTYGGLKHLCSGKLVLVFQKTQGLSSEDSNRSIFFSAKRPLRYPRKIH